MFVHDDGQIVMQFDGTGAGDLTASDLTHRYLWGPGIDQLVADEQVSSTATEGEVLWALADHQGTVRDVVDENGTVRVHLQYDAFGVVTGIEYFDSQGNAIGEGDAEAVEWFIRHTGLYFDDSTGLLQNRARWRELETNQFLSEDPIKDGFNWRIYVGNSPMMYTDPSGLKEQPGVIRSGIAGAFVGFAELGRALSYPLRWLGADFSSQDAALERAYDNLLPSNDNTTRPITRRAVGTAVGAGVGAGVVTVGPKACAIFLATEAAEEGFERTTGIPVITDPKDLLERGFKKGAKEVATSRATKRLFGKTTDDLSNAGRALDPADKAGQFTKAGRSLTKHQAGARAGSTKFPKAKGNPTNVNNQAQDVLDNILNDPRSTFTKGNRGRFGDTIEVSAPDGRGVVFDSNGNFLFFKE